MKATELRIGNWVEIKDQEVKTYAQVEGTGNLQHVAGQLWSIEELKPIPLTEKWLERFGFEKVRFDDNYWFEKQAGDFSLITNDIGKIAFNEKLDHVFISETIQPKIKTINQLQNIYFALTGEEIELKK